MTSGMDAAKYDLPRTLIPLGAEWTRLTSSRFFLPQGRSPVEVPEGPPAKAWKARPLTGEQFAVTST